MVLHGDTAIVQYGIGTFGSRGTAVGGPGAVLRAAGSEEEDQEVRRRCCWNRTTSLFAAASAPATSTGKIAWRWPQIAGGHVSRHEAAAQYRAGPGGHALLGAAQLHFPVRRAHRGDGSGSRHRRRSRSCATSRWTIAATSSIRCWWMARSTAAWRRASGRRCGKQAVYDDNGQLVTGELMDYAVPKAQHDAVDRERATPARRRR